MHQAEEDLLVLAAQDGSRKALESLCQRYQKPLIYYAFKVCGDMDLAQDAVQEAWLQATKSIRKLNDPRAFRSWMYKLVRWRSIDLGRTIARVRKKEDLFLEDKHSDSDEVDLSDCDDLRMAIKRLPATEKQIIHLFYFDDLRMVEIATILDIPEGTAKSRLNRARRLLKQRFDI